MPGFAYHWHTIRQKVIGLNLESFCCNAGEKPMHGRKAAFLRDWRKIPGWPDRSECQLFYWEKLCWRTCLGWSQIYLLTLSCIEHNLPNVRLPGSSALLSSHMAGAPDQNTPSLWADRAKAEKSWAKAAQFPLPTPPAGHSLLLALRKARSPT